MPNRASEEAGSHAGEKTDPSGDGVQKKRRKADAKETVKTFEPPASATRRSGPATRSFTSACAESRSRCWPFLRPWEAAETAEIGEIGV